MSGFTRAGPEMRGGWHHTVVLSGAPLAVGEGVVARGCLQDLVAHRLGRFTSVVTDNALGDLACERQLLERLVCHAGRGVEDYFLSKSGCILICSRILRI